ncbi:hypothetical protein FGADI_9710 [Fusarium gaditjirri]|uniref:Uncharacterized protein n=1 Tax=Fusarium gaditjirri TaxID=282569 RepID=A0A8H4SZF8_9HYPO|nr:hypothetical protein FGADI_9710 [Fusarium gaditjirri]
MANLVDRVSHTLELAQQIVFELEVKDFFRALSITKCLRESQVPDHVWEEHFMRLGYSRYAIRRTSHPLKTCYMRTTQAIDAISHGVKPEASLLRLRDKLGGRYEFQFDRNDGALAPLILRSLPDYAGDECDIFVLDVDELRLLFTKVEGFPQCAMICGPVLLGREYSLEGPWQAEGPLYRHPLEAITTKAARKNCEFYEHFILTVHVMYHKAVRRVFQTWLDVWDIQGTKLEEILFLKEGFMCDGFHSHDGHHYVTMYGSPWAEDGPQTVQTWDLERMELTYEYTIPQENKDKGHFCIANDGIVYFWDEEKQPFKYWSVDGRPVSRKMAEMKWDSLPRCPGIFSYGSRVLSTKWLTLYTNKGDVVKRYNLKREGEYHLEAGVLFDRFFFRISWRGKSKSASLVVYSKAGEKLAWSRLRVRGSNFSWFIDISGRLVLVWDKSQCVETIDFRGILE